MAQADDPAVPQRASQAGASHPSITQAIDYLFNDTHSPWSNILARDNGSWLSDFWHTPLSISAGFRKQALRALDDKTLAGSITFNPHEDWNSRMEAEIKTAGEEMGFRGSDGDPDTPPPGKSCSFRVCDAYAYFYSQYQKGPKCQLFWPEEKRDAAVAACRDWLQAIK